MQQAPGAQPLASAMLARRDGREARSPGVARRDRPDEPSRPQGRRRIVAYGSARRPLRRGGLALSRLYAACMLNLGVACYSGEFCQLQLGSGPRGRWFESTRPDQFHKNPRKSAVFRLADRSVFSCKLNI
jgi:hypothetical protein